MGSHSTREHTYWRCALALCPQCAQTVSVLSLRIFRAAFLRRYAYSQFTTEKMKATEFKSCSQGTEPARGERTMGASLSPQGPAHPQTRGTLDLPTAIECSLPSWDMLLPLIFLTRPQVATSSLCPHQTWTNISDEIRRQKVGGVAPPQPSSGLCSSSPTCVSFSA